MIKQQIARFYVITIEFYVYNFLFNLIINIIPHNLDILYVLATESPYVARWRLLFLLQRPLAIMAT